MKVALWIGIALKVALWIGIALLVLWTIKVVFEKISKRPIGLGNLASRFTVPAWVKNHWLLLLVVGWLLIVAGPWVVPFVFWQLPTWSWSARLGTQQDKKGDANPEPVAPQGKSVGGPLWWSKKADVIPRKRNTIENVKNGVCFVGIIPPRNIVQTTFFSGMSTTTSTSWKAFLVQHNASGLLPIEVLQQHAIATHGVRAGAFRLTEFHGGTHGARQTLFLKNETGYGSEPPDVVDFYMQISQNGPECVQIDRQYPPGTFQYEVRVGMQEVFFKILHENWKWLWVASVHHPDYQASLENGSNPKQGIMARVNGKLETLEKPLLYQPGDLASSQIDLMLLLDMSGITSAQIESISPATVIVGIQL